MSSRRWRLTGCNRLDDGSDDDWLLLQSPREFPDGRCFYGASIAVNDRCRDECYLVNIPRHCAALIKKNKKGCAAYAFICSKKKQYMHTDNLETLQVQLQHLAANASILMHTLKSCNYNSQILHDGLRCIENQYTEKLRF